MVKPTPIGTIIGAHGVRGAVKVKTAADDFKALVSKHPVSISDSPISLRVIGGSSSPFVVVIDGIATRDAAEALRGTVLTIISEKKVNDASYRVSELVGLSVYENGVEVAKLTRLFNFGAGEVVELAFTNGETELFPFTAQTFPSVDITAGRAELVRPEII